jgi:hypothetical protein
MIAAEASEDALHFQKQALAAQLKRLDNLDPNALANQATLQDIARRANALLAQQQVDPALAAVRRIGAEQIVREAEQGSRSGDVLAEQLFQEVRTQDPKLAALKQQLLDEAKAELDAGATLPPEFQAELVRTGLERSGQAGFGTTGQGLGGVQLRKLIGSEGLALKQARQSQATQLAGAAQDIENARVNILGSVFPRLKDLATSNLSRAQSIFGTGESTVPGVGISGEDVVNINLTKAGAQNQIISQSADKMAQGAIAQGKMINQLIGAGTELATSTIKSLEPSQLEKDIKLAKKHGLI